MSTVPPPDHGPRRRLLSPAMISAIAATVVLAIVVVIVAINRDDSDPDPAAGGSTTTASQPGDDGDSGSSSASGTVTDDSVGLAYDYPIDSDPFSADKWDGPISGQYGAIELLSRVGYESCTPDAGVDILFGFIAGEGDDLLSAAQGAWELAVTNLVNNSVDSSDISDQAVTTDSGLKGHIYEGNVTRSEPDECNNSTLKVAALAVKNDADDTIVMIASYRTDGDREATTDELLDAAIDAMTSLRLA